MDGSSAGATRQPLLSVSGLTVAFATQTGPIEAVRGIDFNVLPGEAVGLVGESGSGKSLTALAIMGLLPHRARILRGSVAFSGTELQELPDRAMRWIRGDKISMIFQDPQTSLNPSFSIGTQLTDVILAHNRLTRRQAVNQAIEALDLVGIPEPRRRLHNFPHEFSGGMRQRVLIAMAIACGPQLLIADEPTTALDVTVQAQVMELLRRLRKELNLSLLFITHNLDLMAESCDRTIVLYGGKVMEEAPVEQLFRSPRHPYTRRLLAAIPRLTSRSGGLQSIEGAPPTLHRLGYGCPFAPRCSEVQDICRERFPTEVWNQDRRVACWVETPNV
jgi:oligopeptide/dipeptide ABC transporter ATP-binding protein